jgi:spermidine synthase
VPIAVLSTVGPISIGMLVRDASRSGRISGMLLAISTAGSVAGTLVLAFVLLPAVRVTHVFAFCAVAMFLVSLGSWLIWRPRRARGAPGGPAVLVVAAAIAWLGRSGPAPMSSRFQVLRETENLHGRLRVVDDEEMSIRWLVSDSSLISASRLHESRPVFEYLNLLEVLIGVAPGAKRALVIGLGAGYVPRRLEEHGLQVDSIEINPAVADAAREFFGFRTSGKLIIGDARYELRGLGEYDLIIHDCFSGGSIPAHVLSLEMMREIRAHLRKGGVLMTSFFGDLTGPDSTATKTIHRTLKEVFPHTKVLVPKRGAEPIDVAFVGSDRPIALDPAFASRLAEPRLKTLAAQFGELEVQLDDSGLDAATDDLNPFDMLQASKAEQYRNLLVERLGIEFFL